MIGVKFNGRLGNQLFQYTFYHYLRSNNKGIFFFTNPHHAYLSKYFIVDTFNNITLSSKLYSIIARLVPMVLTFKEIYIQNIQVPKAVTPKPWSVYKGFFQTDWYLKNVKGDLKIEIKKEFVDRFEHLFGSLFSSHKTIVVHIRRTDYMNYGKRDISLPLEYFQYRLNCIENIESYKVIFVSDDMKAVKAYFEEKENYIFSTNDEIIDFQIIMNADIAIISNSSFAWWAGYLSPKNNQVFAPKNWLGFRIGKEHPKKVMTDKFIWCDVLENSSDNVATNVH
jgi:hypothetical protein